MFRESQCCECSMRFINLAGHKGMSIVIKNINGKYLPCLQMRSLDIDEENHLSQLQKTSLIQNSVTGPFIRVAEQIAIHFCPFCGRNIAKWLSKHKNIAIELAKKHECFIMGK